MAPIESDLLHATCTPEGQVTFRNPAWQALFGGGDGLWERLAETDVPQAEQCVRDAAAGQLITHQIFPVEVPNRDEPVPVLLNFMPVHLPRAAAQETTDVVAVNLVGETLAEPTSWIASQTQRDRMANLGHMTMGIAHDFNNLLSGILGHTELVKAQLAGLPDALREHVVTIERAALDGATLIKKIQRYIRQEKQTDYEPLELPELVRECISLTRPYWHNEPRRKGISIKIKHDLDDVPPLLGSPTELREVLVNLILNAVQAMPSGGRMFFSTRQTPDDDVQLTVRDTGTGMPEDVKRRIFEPLFTTKGQHGTGMGLAVSYGIVQEHGGTIEVDSTAGEGTTFTLTFPPASEVGVADEAAEPEAPSSVARILIVDDEPMVRNVLSKLLELRGHSVTVSSSGPEALQRTDEQPFDLVITDQAMPEMSGRRLARELRRRFPDLPILLLTGDTETGTADADIDAVLGKPFQIDDVEATLQDLLRNRS